MGFVTAPERMNPKLRQAIALEAARLMYERQETEYYTAKRKAAKRLCRQGIKPEDLPSNAEIRTRFSSSPACTKATSAPRISARCASKPCA
jgi:hypothetical protein